MRRRNTLRLKAYNYSSSGYYFVTICTKNRISRFGSIYESHILLNKNGSLIRHNWLKIPEKFPGAKIDSFVIMPNHLHGILSITSRGVINHTPTNKLYFSQINNMRTTNLSKIIRWFKGRSTYDLRQINKDFYFNWQRGFYDRIIRNNKELLSIRNYINNNPSNWNKDDYFV